MKIDFEKLLAEYGLKVGDKVNMDNSPYNPYIITHNEIRGFELITSRKTYLDIQSLWHSQWEKVVPKKKVGEFICENSYVACCNCPLQCIACQGNLSDSIRKRWINTLKTYPQLEPMRPYIETELDKEVEEE